MSISEQEFLQGAFKGNVEVVREYLQSGGDPNVRGKRGQTALMLSIWGGRSYDIAKLLVDHGADLTPREESTGWRALTYAAVNGHADILQLFFDHGDTIASDGSDWKALLYAIQYRNPITAEILLEHGIGVDLRDEEEMTSLMRAAKNSDAISVRMLLDRGANPNLVDANGMTPLMHAAGKANVENIQLLLERGADPLATNNAGQSALDIAREKKKTKIAAALEAHMSSAA